VGGYLTVQPNGLVFAPTRMEHRLTRARTIELPFAEDMTIEVVPPSARGGPAAWFRRRLRVTCDGRPTDFRMNGFDWGAAVVTDAFSQWSASREDG